MKKIILALAALAAALVLGGCFRQHIESAPPVRQPAQTTAAPAQPVIEETHVVGDEKPLDGPVEEVYEVDAAKQAGQQAPAVGEADLAEESLPDADQLKREAEAAAAQGTPPAKTAVPAQAAPAPVAAQAAPAAPAAPAVKAPTNPEDEVVGIGDETEMPGAAAVAAPAEPPVAAPAVAAGGPYYVQVGAFSDVTNANRALERLIADGYKGSVMVKTDEGLFRVQAGSFPDEATAGAALEKLKADYPKGFVLKKP
ncbi:Sporulation domain-containing protein [Pseudodesulfovibrio mercurii]|uniref:Sporulation domain-containing protein n=1 Tax=Pseudodesulfovibrio mercurii TaxID=641491 RepID=F0JGS3_9BACT|nr:SPOR domain-containing protein [Pseudodesulfovibrio mercurii]EGB15113.1 Sporulation domain-containing protein [Pseudodesulfovibrio mercurii]